MMSSSELRETASPVALNSLKLLSVNEVREILKLRYETVKRLIEEGKIEVLVIGKRIKIPVASLKKFIEDNTRALNEEAQEEHQAETRDFVNDKVDSIIKKHTRRC